MSAITQVLIFKFKTKYMKMFKLFMAILFCGKAALGVVLSNAENTDTSLSLYLFPSICSAVGLPISFFPLYFNLCKWIDESCV